LQYPQKYYPNIGIQGPSRNKKNLSEESSLQLTTSLEASEHKLLTQAHRTGTANIHCDK